MRILTVRQPWAWAIIHAGKNIENRSRNIAGSYRGPVAIHAALAFDSAPFSDVHFHERWLASGGDNAPGGWGKRYQGVIVGVVDLVDVHDGSVESIHARNGDVIATSACSPWALPDHHHLELANPRRLENPIPFTGSIGLRRLDADMVERITEEVAA